MNLACSGACHSAWWRRWPASRRYGGRSRQTYTASTVEIVEAEEGAAYGGALLAGVGTGIWGSVDDACRDVVRRYASVSSQTRLLQATTLAAHYQTLPRRFIPALASLFHQAGVSRLCQTQQQQEIATKTARIVDLLKAGKQDALLIRRNENLAWITAGILDRRVALPSDTNVCSILVTSGGDRFYLTTNNEAPRLADEDFPGLGFEAIIWPWHQDGLAEAIKGIVKTGSYATDQPTNAAPVLDLTALRTPLLPAEMERYREAGRQAAGVVTSVLNQLKPGITESQMNALAAAELWAAGMEPTVLLMAVDDRILKYKHAVAHGDTLKKYGMVNLCARKAGLAISITRFVHFGPVPQQLTDMFGVAAEVNASLLAASHAGAISGELYAAAQQAYTAAGFAGEEEHHHQGGPCGYLERDWVAAPNGQQRLVDGQGLAWNPSIRGGKVEDTVLLSSNRIELLTSTPDLPQVNTRIGALDYVSAGVLTR